MRRTPHSDPCCTEKGKSADCERLSAESAWSETRALGRDPELRAGSPASVGNNPAGIGAQSIPWAQTPERPPSFLPQPSEASGPLQRPQPPAAPLARLRKEAVPAPPSAAPTRWRKNSFPKPELGTSVPLSAFYVDTYLCRP